MRILVYGRILKIQISLCRRWSQGVVKCAAIIRQATVTIHCFAGCLLPYVDIMAGKRPLFLVVLTVRPSFVLSRPFYWAHLDPDGGLAA